MVNVEMFEAWMPNQALKDEITALSILIITDLSWQVSN